MLRGALPNLLKVLHPFVIDSMGCLSIHICGVLSHALLCMQGNSVIYHVPCGCMPGIRGIPCDVLAVLPAVWEPARQEGTASWHLSW